MLRSFRKTVFCHGLALSWMAACCFLPASAASGAFSFDYLTEVTSGKFPEAETCTECHSAIVAEWAQSPHESAFTRASFRKATNDHAFGECLGCHAPEPRLSAEVPAARDTRPEEGVTCVACHLREGKIWGPHTPSGLMESHPVGVDPERYRSASFCGRCHEGTLAEWESVEVGEKPTCQDCHMPPVRRKISQASSVFGRPFVALEKTVDQKRHTFDIVPADLDEPPFAILAQRNATTVTLTIENHLLHSLPTGDFGVRIVGIEVSAAGNAGERVVIGRRELVKELGEAIPPRASLRWPVAVPEKVRALYVRMWREGRAGANAIDLIETEVTLP